MIKAALVGGPVHGLVVQVDRAVFVIERWAAPRVEDLSPGYDPTDTVSPQRGEYWPAMGQWGGKAPESVDGLLPFLWRGWT